MDSTVETSAEKTQAPDAAGYFERHPNARWAVIAGAIILAIAIFGLWEYYSTHVTTDDAEIEAHIDPISARVGGTVITVLVEDNERVKAGDVLVEIDPTDYQVAVERAEANYAATQAKAQQAQVGVPITSTTTGSHLSVSQAGIEQAKANLTAAERGVAASEAQLAAAKARLAQERADALESSQNLERYKQLIGKDEISRQQFDAAVARADANAAAVKSAEAQVAAAREAVSVARSKVIDAQAGYAQAEANLRAARTAPEQVAAMRAQAAAALAEAQQAKAALDQAKLNLSYTTVRAPATGVVSEKSVEIGQVIAQGQPLMAIVPLNDVWVVADYKETQLHNMRPGQKATIHVDAFGRDYDGYVQSIAAGTGSIFSLLPPENATGNYVKVVQRIPVKIYFDKGQDPNHLLRAGMSVEPTVITK